jgi:hypothetical protein
MIAASALLLMLQAVPADTVPATPRFGALWADWKRLGREAVGAELAPQAKVPSRSNDAAALGERVGEVVAGGDCAIGERLAREAGDIPLARAVRDHCYGSVSPR